MSIAAGVAIIFLGAALVVSTLAWRSLHQRALALYDQERAEHQKLQAALRAWSEDCPNRTPLAPEALKEWYGQRVVMTYLGGLVKRPVA